MLEDGHVVAPSKVPYHSTSVASTTLLSGSTMVNSKGTASELQVTPVSTMNEPR